MADLISMFSSTGWSCGPTVSAMTEPPRPPGEGSPYDPYAGNDPHARWTPPPGYQPPPVTQDDRTWILLSHFGGAAGTLLGGALAGWIVPLIVMLAKGNQSPVVRAESVKALNFQLLWSIIGLIGWATTCIGIGFAIVAVAWLVAIIFGVVAGIKAANNEPYAYPLSVTIVR